MYYKEKSRAQNAVHVLEIVSSPFCPLLDAINHKEQIEDTCLSRGATMHEVSGSID
jgi:hypothetical protein